MKNTNLTIKILRKYQLLCIDKRTAKLVSIIRNYIGDLAGEEFEQFVDVKTKLIVDIKEVEEKLKTVAADIRK